MRRARFYFAVSQVATVACRCLSDTRTAAAHPEGVGHPMTIHRRRPPAHPDLKIAIVSSNRTQRRVALAARLAETRLSDIIRGRGAPATDDEKTRIARALRSSVSRLFRAPAPTVAPASAA